MWLAPVFTKQSSHQVSESGDTFQHLAFLGQFTIVDENHKAAIYL